MNFLHEKAARNFLTAILFFLFFFFLLDLIIWNIQKHTIQKIMLHHDYAIASSLLEQNISASVIAKAITDTTITPKGEALLGKLGIQENTNLCFLPFLLHFSCKTLLINGIKFVLLTFILLTLVLFFLYKREILYQQAVKIVSNYSEGNFQHHLPQSDNGSIYHLFGCINNMAYVLKSKNELEHNTKEFLKNTISNISHQLKTPLAALSMYNEIILDEPNNHSTVLLFAQKSDIAIKRIQTLILTLLKLTRLDAGGIDFEKKEYFLTEVIYTAIESLTIRAENENKNLILKGNPNETILCDINWTSEAIGNIVKNALDHTNANGEIVISWKRTPIEISIFIADNGSGIEPEDFHHIFKRFYRSKNSSPTQGIGLGLPLAKSVIEGQGGTISVQSKPKEGTLFFIQFPYKMTKL